MPKLSSKNQVTIPVDVMREAGLKPGDHVVVHAAGPGHVELERPAEPLRAAAEADDLGVLDMLASGQPDRPADQADPQDGDPSQSAPASSLPAISATRSTRRR